MGSDRGVTVLSPSSFHKGLLGRSTSPGCRCPEASSKINHEILSIDVGKGPVGGKLAAGADQRIRCDKRLSNGSPELVILVQLPRRSHFCSPAQRSTPASLVPTPERRASPGPRAQRSRTG